MTKTYWIAAVLVLAGIACRTDREAATSAAPSADLHRIGDVWWYLDYDAAVAAAEREDKPLWVHFGEDPG